MKKEFKKLSEQDLFAKAEGFFNTPAYSEEEVVLITEDGTVFKEEKRGAAVAHGRSLGALVYTIVKNGEELTGEDPSGTAIKPTGTKIKRQEVGTGIDSKESSKKGPSKAELQEKAKELGIEFTTKTTKDELKALIFEYEKPLVNYSEMSQEELVANALAQTLGTAEELSEMSQEELVQLLEDNK